jgi:hypothetical protein
MELLLSTMMPVKLLQPENAPFPIDLTDEDMLTLAKLLQP